MNDLISRQAAIDILDAYQVMVENGEENPYSWARLRMSELPSAQPDLSDYSDKLWRNAYERGKEEARIQKMQDLEQAEIQKAYELGKLDAMEEIVRCRDCKHWKQDHTCREHSLVSPMMANEFCSRAERREE